ncbi:MAG: reverse transcriptase/ribonuclease H family protein, partial [Candidatus Saccharimonadales bacterium]
MAHLPPKWAALVEKYKQVFPDELPPGLPMKRPVEHRIEIKPGSLPVAKRQYRISIKDMASMERHCQAALRTGKVTPSTSPYNSPCLITPKPGTEDGRWIQDSRGVNAQTVKDKITMPRVDDLFDRGPMKCLTRLDMKNGFNQMRIVAEDTHKTAFSTSSGHYEWLVLPFGLCNGPASFQRLMQTILLDRLYRGVLVFIDDILIYSMNEDDHLRDVEWVLAQLKKWKLYASIKKCEFMKEEVEFLGHKISSKGISVLAGKVKAVEEWPQPQNAKEVRSFLGLAGYYRKFVKNFSGIAAPLSDLTKDQRLWHWGVEQEKAFLTLKAALLETPVLARPQLDKPFTVTTDASGFAVGGVLTQEDEKGDQRPVAFLSHKMSPAECNYPVHEQELLAIVYALEEWRCYLLSEHPVTVVTDHQSLKFINSQPVLSGRQARWVEFLQEFDLVQGCIVVPEDRSLRTKLLHEVHDTPTGGHLGL